MILFNKRIFLTTFFVSALLLASLTPGPAWAEVITFDGTDLSLLKLDPTSDHEPGNGYLYPASDSSSNKVTVSTGAGSKITDVVFGGYSLNGDVATNEVIIKGDTTNIGISVLGGFTENGIAHNNSVTIENGMVEWAVNGGSAAKGTAENNSINIKNGTVKQFVFGGTASIGNALNNHVIISGGTIGMGVEGGLTTKGIAQQNTVTISGGTVGHIVHGGYVETGDAKDNIATISGGTMKKGVYGGLAVIGNAENNTAIINGGIMLEGVLGGETFDGNAKGNSVKIISGIVKGDVYGGSGDEGVVENNSVAISGGTVEGSVIGGDTFTGDARGNTVTISGGTLKGDVYGGWTGYEDQYGNLAGGGKAINNTVTISGVLDLATAKLYGGSNYNTNATFDTFTGNTLNLMPSKTLKVTSMQNFEFINFTVPKGYDTSQPLMTVSGTADITNGQVTVNTAADARQLEAGDTVVLIKAGTLKADGVARTATGSHGLDAIYEFVLNTADNTLTATIGTERANNRAKALFEGSVTSAALLNRSADLASGAGLNAALNSASIGSVAPFLAISGGSLRHKTGSHVDVDSLSLMLGLSLKNDFSPGNLRTGAFFESGWGSYKSFNDFSDAASVKGEGNSNYYGLGLLGRFDFNCGFYTDASARIGRSEIDFTSHDLLTQNDRSANYNSSSTYYGAHFGLGYLYDVSEATTIDFSVKYLWTRQGADTMMIDGDRVHFNSITSSRAHIGAKISHQASERFAPYFGVAYEHEFDGKANGSINNRAIVDAPKLKGGTVIGELGLRITPQTDSNVFVDFGVQGYGGRTQGVSGTATLKFEF